MPGKAKPAPPGYVTATHVAKKSGLHPYSVRDMFNRGDLKGKRESGVSGSTGDRILVTRASAAGFLNEVRKARQAERDLRGGYSVEEFADDKDIPAGTLRKACEDGKIDGAKKIKFKKGGVGGQWRLPASMGNLTTAGVRDLLASKQKPKVRSDYRRDGYLTPGQISERLASEGTPVNKTTIRRWAGAKKITPASKRNGISFFSEAQLPTLRQLAGNSRAAKPAGTTRGAPAKIPARGVRIAIKKPEAKPKTTKSASKGSPRRPSRVSQVKERAGEAYRKLAALRSKNAAPKTWNMERLLSELRRKGLHMSEDYIEEWVERGDMEGLGEKRDGEYYFHPDAVFKVNDLLRGA